MFIRRDSSFYFPLRFLLFEKLGVEHLHKYALEQKRVGKVCISTTSQGCQKSA